MAAVGPQLELSPPYPPVLFQNGVKIFEGTPLPITCGGPPTVSLPACRMVGLLKHPMAGRGKGKVKCKWVESDEHLDDSLSASEEAEKSPDPGTSDGGGRPLGMSVVGLIAKVTPEDTVLLVQRALVLLGSVSHGITQERRHIAWARINPKAQRPSCMINESLTS